MQHEKIKYRGLLEQYPKRAELMCQPNTKHSDEKQTIARQDKNTQSDREFQALSGYVIKILQKLFRMTTTKSSVWESGDEGAFITLDLFFSTLVQTKIQIYRVLGNFTGFQNISLLF
jgi:hypothetical protein